MGTLIVPCAGKSTRFTGSRPKFLLTHPSGEAMVVKALEKLDYTNIDIVYITVLKQHALEFRFTEGILQQLEHSKWFPKHINVVFVELDHETSSQPSTVYRTIKEKNIKGQIYIKDCDNQFLCKMPTGTWAAYIDIEKQQDINPLGKSFIRKSTQGISTIVEKTIISDLFCCGLYAFNEADNFLEQHYNCLSRETKESHLYISHLLQSQLYDGCFVGANEASNYHDWGTQEEWDNYCSKFRTLLVDIDGTLVKSSCSYMEPKVGTTDKLVRAVEKINTLYDEGFSQIILVTARPEYTREVTEDQLYRLGIKHHRLVMGLWHTRRVLINDFAVSNPYPSAVAINLVRDLGNLDVYL